ncbi:MAG: hypothetical protein RJQ09_08580 [Cyclobacteriaceae bacterium]
MEKEIPIAVCYLNHQGDDRNKCVLNDSTLRIIKDGRLTTYPLESGLSFSFSRKKWMFPLIGGSILGCMSVLFIYNNLFHPWISLTAMVVSALAIYFGYEGSLFLVVRMGKVENIFPVKRRTDDFRMFIARVQKRIVELEQNTVS